MSGEWVAALSLRTMQVNRCRVFSLAILKMPLIHQLLLIIMLVMSWHHSVYWVCVARWKVSWRWEWVLVKLVLAAIATIIKRYILLLRLFMDKPRLLLKLMINRACTWRIAHLVLRYRLCSVKRSQVAPVAVHPYNLVLSTTSSFIWWIILLVDLQVWKVVWSRKVDSREASTCLMSRLVHLRFQRLWSLTPTHIMHIIIRSIFDLLVKLLDGLIWKIGWQT